MYPLIAQMPSCHIATKVNDHTASISSLTTTVHDHSNILSCDSGRRRLDVEPPPHAASAEQVLRDFLATRPRTAAKLDAELLADMEELGQHFGLPAHA